MQEEVTDDEGGGYRILFVFELAGIVLSAPIEPLARIAIRGFTKRFRLTRSSSSERFEAPL